MDGENWRKDKRNHGGSIKVINGITYARIQYVDEITGKRKEKLERADNRTDARKRIKQMREKLDTNGADVFDSNKLTFEQLADKYQKTHLTDAVFTDGKKVSGLKSAFKTKGYLAPLKAHFGRKHIRKIKPSDLEAYKNERATAKTIKGTQRKVASVNRELELLRAMFNFAVRQGWISQNPFGRTKSLISKASEVERERTLSHDEERSLLNACGERTVTYKRGEKEITMVDKGTSRKHLRALIIVAVDTGARRGELFKLQWKDVDLASETITIQAANSKTEKKRTIGMTERVKAELEKLKEKSPDDPERLVFGITDTIKKGWQSLCDAAGIADIRFHDLRHTATTRLIRAGVPHAEVMKITGHTQMKTFLRYLNITNETANKSANLLSAYLSENGPSVPEILDTVN